MKYIVSLLALILTLMFSGCSDSSTPPATPVLQSIELSPPISELAVGTTENFEATGFYSDGTQENITAVAVWTLENDNGSVELSGSQVKALTEGSDTIVATLNSIKKSAEIIVSSATLVTLEIIPQDTNILVGYGEEFKAEGNYSDGHTQDLTQEADWISNNPSVAEISTRSNNGDVWVDAKSDGNTTIEVSYDGITSTATVSTYSEAHITHITISPEDELLLINGNRRYSTQAHFSDGDYDVITKNTIYQSSDTSIASFNPSSSKRNEIRAHSEGNTTITASYKGHTVQTQLEVEKYQIQYIRLYPNQPELSTVKVGETLQYLTEAILVNPNGQVYTISNWNDDLKYSTNDNTIASISNIIGNRGLLTGMNEGVTFVHVSFEYEGETFTAEANVTVVP